MVYNKYAPVFKMTNCTTQPTGKKLLTTTVQHSTPKITRTPYCLACNPVHVHNIIMICDLHILQNCKKYNDIELFTFSTNYKAWFIITATMMQYSKLWYN